MSGPLRIGGYALYLTCSACPEQYDVHLGYRMARAYPERSPIIGGQVGYLRLRHGEFTARYPDAHGEVVYSSEPEGDGAFEDDEREEHLVAAIRAIHEQLAAAVEAAGGTMLGIENGAPA